MLPADCKGALSKTQGPSTAKIAASRTVFAARDDRINLISLRRAFKAHPFQITGDFEPLTLEFGTIPLLIHRPAASGKARSYN